MKPWIGATLFFGFALIVGLAVTSIALSRSSSPFAAVLTGAATGAFAATFAAPIVARFLRGSNRPPPPP